MGLQRGERVAWTSRFGTYEVVLQRTDAGQTYTVVAYQRGREVARQVHYDEGTARTAARFAAISYRELEALEVVTT